MRNNILPTPRLRQAFLAITALLLLCALNWGTLDFFWVPFILGFYIIALIKGFADPAFFSLIFFTFCLFRIQEFIPSLRPFQIPMTSALLGIVSLLYNSRLHRKDIYWRPEMTYFTLFFLHVSVGVLLAHDFNTAYYDWLKVFSKFPLIFFLITWSLQDKKDFKWLIIITIFCGTLIALIIIYNKLYGIGLIEGRAGVQAGKPTLLADPNDLAFTLLIPLSFSCAAFFSKSIPSSIRLLMLSSSILITSAIVSTQSRGGLLGLTGVLVYFFSRRFKSKILIILLGSALLIFFMPERQTWDEHGQLDESASGRIHAWKAAVNMAIHHPVFGVSLSGFIPHFHQYAIGPGNTSITAHSSWFLVLAESGFIGFILFVTCVYLSIKATYFSIQHIEALDETLYPQKPLYLIFSYGLFSSFIGYCISGSFLSQGFTWPIYILLALSVSLAYSTKKIINANKFNGSNPEISIRDK